MRSIYLLLILILFSAVLAATSTGCKNTAHGAGEDIENMGEKIQDKTD